MQRDTLIKALVIIFTLTLTDSLGRVWIYPNEPIAFCYILQLRQVVPPSRPCMPVNVSALADVSLSSERIMLWLIDHN